MLEPNEKIIQRFKEFIETYPERDRFRVKSPNCVGLMQWSWHEAQKELLQHYITLCKNPDARLQDIMDALEEDLETIGDTLN
jgi:hypothetical protein